MPPHYFVDAGLVKQASEEIRAYLDEISAEFRQQPPGQSVFNRRWLPKLAEAGAVLSEQVFRACDGDRATAADVRSVIESATEELGLTVFTDGFVHVPWAFLYRGEPDDVLMDDPDLDGAASLEDFSHFWLRLFKIYVRYSVNSRISGNKSNRRSFRLLCALNRDLFNQAMRLLSPDEQERSNKLLQYEVGEATTWQICKEKWRAIENKNSIVYFFGHSTGEDIILEESTRIPATHFSRLFKKRDGVSDTICILNGCRTGVGPLFDSFIKVTSGPGFQGFVGTEAEISNHSAARYGIALMEHICENGCTLGEAFAKLQKENFPESLFYTCYANPGFKVPKH